MSAAYAKVSVTDGVIDDEFHVDHIELTDINKDVLEDFEDEVDGIVDHDHQADDDGNERYPIHSGHTRLPLEVVEEQLLWNVWNRWEEPCLLSITVTICFLLPTLLLWMYGSFAFVGRFWSIWIFVLHLQIRLTVSIWYIKSISIVSFKRRRSLRFACSAMTILEICLLIIYRILGNILIEACFRDIDEEIVPEWKKEVRFINIALAMGWLVILLRCCVGIPCLVIRAAKYRYFDVYREWRPIFWIPCGGGESLGDITRYRLQRVFRLFNLLVFTFHIVCILSALSHFGPWPIYSFPEDCNDLDETECALPFPSFHHMNKDGSSPTGWRVHLRGLPPLRGGIPFHPRFLNDLDGFSTMAPMLFYMDGLKEAHKNSDNRKGLQGPESIADSVTVKSITLLIDVEEQKLVPHSAEVDYLDQERPLIMVFPAQPLKHQTHYAVAVVGALDENGRQLPRTKGMDKLLKMTNSETRTRMIQTVIPALQAASGWYSFATAPESLQLLFDFMTVSEESQLGPVRAARDKALEHVKTWNWNDHVYINSIVDAECRRESFIARTIHLTLDVPSFLHHESRYSFLNLDKIEGHHPLTIGKARAMIQIPCSIKTGSNIQAIMEYGHGLFYNRLEMTDDFLQKIAHDNSYIVMAMDWRGMSIFDLPIVIKTLIGTPDLFQAVRDNLIQGFVNKLCLQHFSQNGMLELDAFKFDERGITSDSGLRPASVFYGISQGGILGGGYVSTAGSTGLIDRGILGVPGTPFALILTRSLDFAGYDVLMLMNFYNNRHVRILLSLVQMAWDSAEASGHRAGPITEKIPRLLIQAGLGDSVVPTIAAEALARSMGASTLPNNPRKMFGVPVEPEAAGSAGENSTAWLGPQVTISELLYEKEFDSLPYDDTFAEPNKVHLCVRLEPKLIEQIEEFINSGRVIDPCIKDQCRRDTANC